MIRSVYCFHVYYHVRRVLKRLQTPLPHETSFNAGDNPYTESDFLKFARIMESLTILLWLIICSKVHLFIYSYSCFFIFIFIYLYSYLCFFIFIFMLHLFIFMPFIFIFMLYLFIFMLFYIHIHVILIHIHGILFIFMYLYSHSCYIFIFRCPRSSKKIIPDKMSRIFNKNQS